MLACAQAIHICFLATLHIQKTKRLKGRQDHFSRRQRKSDKSLAGTCIHNKIRACIKAFLHNDRKAAKRLLQLSSAIKTCIYPLKGVITKFVSQIFPLGSINVSSGTLG